MRAAFVVALIPALLFGCVEKEGDFAIEMPANGPLAQSAPDQEPAALEIRLKADAHGKLAGVFLGGQQLVVDHENADLLDSLSHRVREILQDTDAQATDSPDHEAVIHVDGPLDYAFVIDATKVVSSYADPDGTVHRLVTRVRFASPDTGDSSRDAFGPPTVDAPITPSQDAHREERTSGCTRGGGRVGQ